MTQLIRWLFVSALLLTLVPACSRDPGPGAVSGQIKFVSPDGSVRNLPGAQIILRGAQDTYTAISTNGETDTPESSYNYRIDGLKPGRYVMAVTPPAGLSLQPEDDLALQVRGGETYAQSVLMLPEGVAKPRPLQPEEVSGDQVGYTQGGQRTTYSSGGLDMSDYLLMYLLFRNPGGYGFGAPPVVIGSPSGTSSGSRYRVEPPPTRTSRGEPISQTPPGVPGQGATRPGSAPSSRAPSGSSGAESPSGSGARGQTTSPPSQGVSRPSAPAPSRPSSGRSGGSSGGGRK